MQMATTLKEDAYFIMRCQSHSKRDKDTNEIRNKSNITFPKNIFSIPNKIDNELLLKINFRSVLYT